LARIGGEKGKTGLARFWPRAERDVLLTNQPHDFKMKLQS